jgi:uncharacterized damage-inducible protein DinB
VKYMLIHFLDESTLEWGAAEDRELETLDAELAARGILTGGGALQPPATATTLRVREGQLLITDGPYAETKEQIAGYSVLECASLDEAIEVAARHPTARLGTFELRPYLPGEEEGDGEKEALRHFLQYQRDSVLAIVAGLDEEWWHRSVVPSGWTPAGLLEHLAGAERHWFQQVIRGGETPQPWDGDQPKEYDPEAAFTCDRPSAEVLAYYREQGRRSDAVLAATPLTARPLGRHGFAEDEEEPANVRWVVLHMIEETASHSGHLEIARELIDGRTNLGLR